jgi:hypothetical protein
MTLSGKAAYSHSKGKSLNLCKERWLFLVEDNQSQTQSPRFRQPILPVLPGRIDKSSTVSCLPISTGVLQGDTRLQQIELLIQDVAVLKGFRNFSENVYHLKIYSDRFVKVDPQLEYVVRPLMDIKEIKIVDLQDRGILVDRHIASLNLDVILKLSEFASSQDEMEVSEWLSIAMTIYFLHEMVHSSQGIPRHEDVQAMKSVNQTSGRRMMVEFDLRSDYLAAHTLSILETFRQNEFYTIPGYEKNMYLIWCKVCRGMLQAFHKPISSRKDKLRRIFGYLLTAHVLCESYKGISPIALKGELLPEWSQNKDKITITSNHRPYVLGQSVCHISMKKILRLILRGDYDAAQDSIALLWKTLPKY